MIYKIHGDRWGGWVLGFTVIGEVYDLWISWSDLLMVEFLKLVVSGFFPLTNHSFYWLYELVSLDFYSFSPSTRTVLCIDWLLSDWTLTGDTIFWSGTFEILMERVWQPSGGWFEKLVLKFHSRINHSSFILKYLRFPGWYVDFSISDRSVSVLLV